MTFMTNENIKIENDFLPQEKFDKIQEFMLKNLSIPWFYADRIVNGEEDKFQFIHIFYDQHQPHQFMNELAPIMNKINPFSVMRVKANLLTRTPENVENRFHVDINPMEEERLKLWTTSIFYVNTNNGYTKFENGTKVESVANRMVTFPANMKHSGASCTDTRIRVIINFNYFAFSTTATTYNTPNIQ